MKLALVVITLISISELYIPLKLTKLNPPPKIYTYLNQKDRLMSPIAVYPYNKTNEALFWMQLYKQPLLNPRGYVNQPSGFDSEEFTNQLTTSSGINKARLLGAKYLVYFHDGNISMPENIPKNSNELLKIDEFNESSDTEKTFSLLGLTLVRVTQLGNSHSNSAYLYKIR